MLETFKIANRRYRIFAVIAIIFNTVIFLSFIWKRSGTVTIDNPSFLALDDKSIFNNKHQRLIWFRLLNSTSGQPYRGTTASSVMLPSDFNVDQFRKTVEAKYNQPGYLMNIPAGAVLVYKNSAAFTRMEHPLNSSTILNDFGTTEDEALIVLVPTSSSSSNESLNSTFDEKRTRTEKSSSFKVNTDQQLENVTASATEKYSVCVLSRFNNANYLLPQWIQYHVFAGVSHFFLLDDCSSSDRRREQFLADCSKRGYCTIEIGSKTDCAREKYHFIFLFQKYGHECLWTTVIDADEYIFLYNFNSGDNPLNFLSRFLQNTSKRMIKMPGYFLESNDYEKRPSGLIIDNYLSGDWNRKIKTIIMSEYVQEWENSHFAIFRAGANLSHGIHNQFADDVDLNVTPSCPYPTSELYLKHFKALSWQDFISERARRNVTSDGLPNPWKVDPRKKWEMIGKFKKNNCTTPSELLRRQMSQLFSKEFKENCWNDTAKLEFFVPAFQ